MIMNSNDGFYYNLIFFLESIPSSLSQKVLEKHKYISFHQELAEKNEKV